MRLPQIAKRHLTDAQQAASRPKPRRDEPQGPRSAAPRQERDENRSQGATQRLRAAGTQRLEPLPWEDEAERSQLAGRSSHTSRRNVSRQTISGSSSETTTSSNSTSSSSTSSRSSETSLVERGRQLLTGGSAGRYKGRLAKGMEKRDRRQNAEVRETWGGSLSEEGRAALMRLDRSGKLSMVDSSYRTLRQELVSFLRAGGDAKLAEAVLGQILNPRQITQAGGRETCVAAGAQMTIAKQNPAAYFRMATGLMTEGTVPVPGQPGETLSITPSNRKAIAEAARAGGWSLSGRLNAAMQTAFTDYANGASEYRFAAGQTVTAGGGRYTGLSVEQAERLSTALSAAPTLDLQPLRQDGIKPTTEINRLHPKKRARIFEELDAQLEAAWAQGKVGVFVPLAFEKGGKTLYHMALYRGRAPNGKLIFSDTTGDHQISRGEFLQVLSFRKARYGQIPGYNETWGTIIARSARVPAPPPPAASAAPARTGEASPAVPPPSIGAAPGAPAQEASAAPRSPAAQGPAPETGVSPTSAMPAETPAQVPAEGPPPVAETPAQVPPVETQEAGPAAPVPAETASRSAKSGTNRDKEESEHLASRILGGSGRS